MATQLNKSKANTKIPKHQRQHEHQRPALKTLLKGAAKSKATRNDAIAQAYLKYGYTLAQISKEVGLHYATISHLIKALE